MYEDKIYIKNRNIYIKNRKVNHCYSAQKNRKKNG